MLRGDWFFRMRRVKAMRQRPKYDAEYDRIRGIGISMVISANQRIMKDSSVILSLNGTVRMTQHGQ
jgi:hypothetical protein